MNVGRYDYLITSDLQDLNICVRKLLRLKEKYVLECQEVSLELRQERVK